MSKLSKSDVEHVANLAKLELTQAEIEKFRQQLSKVIAYFEELNEVDTSKVEPTSQTTGLENVFREDEVKTQDCLSQEEALSGTEAMHKGLFKVPGILKERTDR